MAEEAKIILEREYIVPLRRNWRNTPKYRRVPRAIKGLKQFIAKHMKVEERDVHKVLMDKLLNEEMWFRGIRKPPVRIKVKTTKYSDGFVKVELAELPQVLKFKAEREKRKLAAKIEEKPGEAKPGEKPAEAKVEGKAEEKKTEAKEKAASGKEKELKVAKAEAKEKKHETAENKGKKQLVRRMTLKK
jgi:large subunit ribosomal protein L31e